MTDQSFVHEDNLPRVRQWVEDAVRHAVNEAAQALNAIRCWCDHTERELRDANRVNDVDYDDAEDEVIRESLRLVGQVRALLPDLSPVGADSAGEVASDERHASDPGRPGLVTETNP